MIKELVFSGKKWFEGQVPNYIGKTITGVQSNIASFTYTPACDNNNVGLDERLNRSGSFKSEFLNGIRIIGQAVLENGDILLMIPADYGSLGSYASSLFVKLADIVKNGGVSSSPLAHIWQALRAFTARKAVNAL